MAGLQAPVDTGLDVLVLDTGQHRGRLTTGVLPEHLPVLCSLLVRALVREVERITLDVVPPLDKRGNTWC